MVFIEIHNFLKNSQYVFRGKRSTALALNDLIEEVTEMDNKMYTMGISKTFKRPLTW